MRYPNIEKRVAMITQSLNNIFEREHTLSLDRLKTISRRDARHFIHDLPEMNPFTEGYMMLMAFDGHSFPLDEQLKKEMAVLELLEQVRKENEELERKRAEEAGEAGSAADGA